MEHVITHLGDALSAMLGNSNSDISLDQRLVAASKKILMQKIEFVPARRTSSLFPLHALRAKYAPLNAKSDTTSNVSKEAQERVAAKVVNDGLPTPDVVLFPPDKVRVDWPSGQRVGVGLVNMGNTCFLNATLQCLSYTAPLVNYLRDSSHINTCKVAGFCMLCELYKHVKMCFDPANRMPVKPHAILQKLRMIAKHMRWGRQEDAHEFLRYVVDALQRADLIGLQQLDQRSKETCAINQIFGGYLRSQVTCLRCHENSNTYDPFLDLCMDVRTASSVEGALHAFVQPELLAKENAYNCARCKCKVTARKAFSIHRAPNVLTVQLKRYRVHGGKVTRHINFSERLDIRPFMSNKQSTGPVWYRLYGVLVHDGMSTNSGHYYCYVRAPGGTWHCMNDSSVYPTSVQRVLGAEAYLLFYVRDSSHSNAAAAATGSAVNGTMTTTPTVGKVVNGLLSPTVVGKTFNGFEKPVSPGKIPSGLSNGGSSEAVNHKPSATSVTLDKKIIEKLGCKNAPTVISDLPKKKLTLKLNGVVNGCLTADTKSTKEKLSAKESSENLSRNANINGSPNAKSCMSPVVPKESPSKPLSAQKLPFSSSAIAMHSDSCQLKPPAAKLNNAAGAEHSKPHSISSQSTGCNGFAPKDEKKSSENKQFSSSSPLSDKSAAKVKGSVESSTSSNTNGDLRVKGERELSAAKSRNAKRHEKRRKLHRVVCATTQWQVSDLPPREIGLSNGAGSSSSLPERVRATTAWEVSTCTINTKSALADRPNGSAAVVVNGTVDGSHSSPKKAELNGVGSHLSSFDKESAKSHAKCVVQSWDQVLPKGYRTSGVSSSKPVSVSQSWDGSTNRRNVDITQELVADANGFGDSVKSWDGGSSVIASLIESERSKHRKRSHEDEIDDEIDQGRVRKFKKHRTAAEDDNAADVPGNRFQLYQDYMNMEKESKKTGIFSLKPRKVV